MNRITYYLHIPYKCRLLTDMTRENTCDPNMSKMGIMNCTPWIKTSVGNEKNEYNNCSDSSKASAEELLQHTPSPQISFRNTT